MNIRRYKGLKALAIFMAFAVAQISLQLTFAAPSSSPSLATFLPQGILAKVTSKGGQPISINGVSSPSGSSVATNAIVETADGVEATIDLGSLGSIDLGPNTKIKIEFECPPEKQNDPNPDECKVKTTVLAGCIVAHYKKGSRHQVDTETEQKIRESDKEKEKKNGGAIPFCHGGIIGAIPAAGLGVPALIAIIATAVIVPVSAIVFFDEGSNPSDSAL